MIAASRAFLFPDPPARGITARIGPALAVSAVLHAVLALGLAPDTPRRNAMLPAAWPIQARIEHLPVTMPGDNTAAALMEEPVRSQQIERETTAVRERSHETRQEAVAATTPASLPLIPDPTVYSARDLDSYPRPVAPLDTGWLEHAMAGSAQVIRVELTVDEHGGVTAVVPAGHGQAGPVETQMRAVLAATRFVPARKDGRAVKSRVLLDIRLGAMTGDR